MSYIFGQDVDFNYNEALKFRFDNALSFPTLTASESGFSFYHTANKKFYGWTGTTWIDFGLGGAGGDFLPLSGGTMNGNIAMNAFDITNVGDISASNTISSGNFTGSSLLLSPTDVEPTSVKGNLYFDDSENTLKQYNGTVWEKVGGDAGAVISDEIYGISWNGDTTTGASRNAIYDKFESFSGDFVDLTTAQSIAGNKTFSGVTTVNNALNVNPTGGYDYNLGPSGLRLNQDSATSPNDGGLTFRWFGGEWQILSPNGTAGSSNPKLEFSNNDTLNNDQLVAVTVLGQLAVSDEVYGVGWDASLEVPTKNAIYDKIESLGGGGTISDVAYAATWDGNTTEGASKNALYDKIETLVTTNSTQNITGQKTFQGSQFFTSTVDMRNGSPFATRLQFEATLPLGTNSGVQTTLGVDNLNRPYWTKPNSTIQSFTNIDALTADREIIIPDKSGTMAMVDDLSGYVDLTNAQSIGGVKTFTGFIQSQNNVIGFNGIHLKAGTTGGGAFGYIASNQYFFAKQGVGRGAIFDISAIGVAVDRTYSFPNKSMTVAGTSDLAASTTGSFTPTLIAETSGSYNVTGGATGSWVRYGNAQGSITSFSILFNAPSSTDATGVVAVGNLPWDFAGTLVNASVTIDAITSPSGGIPNVNIIGGNTANTFYFVYGSGTSGNTTVLEGLRLSGAGQITIIGSFVSTT